MFLFILLAGQGQNLANSTLSLAQSQFLLGIVARSHNNIISSSLQSSRAGNRNIVVGNLGPVITGAQDANPLNVR